MVTAPPKPEEMCQETIAFMDGIREFYEAEAARNELIEKTLVKVKAIIWVLEMADDIEWIWDSKHQDWEIYCALVGYYQGALGGTIMGATLGLARKKGFYQGE